MRFSSPVFFDDGENMFLAEGKPILEYHLDALKRWKLTYVVTYGKVLAENELPPTSDSLSDDVEELEVLDEFEELEELEELEEVDSVEELDEAPAMQPDLSVLYRFEPDLFESTYQQIIATVEHFFNSYAKGESISRSIIDQTAQTIQDSTITDIQQVVTWIMNKGSGVTYPERAVDGAFLCAAVAKRLNMMPRKITYIIQASLLHDIAMVSVPAAIRNKAGTLTNEEFEQLKLHTIRAGKICNDQLLLPREVADIVTAHHERWDGSGYPDGRKESEIDLGARILAVIDAFEAMTSDKPYRDSLSSYDSVKLLLKGSGVMYDSMVVKGFIQTLGVYPTGSRVKLSDGAICKVIETPEDALFLPTVALEKCGTGCTASLPVGEIIRLHQQRQLFVVKSVD